MKSNLYHLSSRFCWLFSLSASMGWTVFDTLIDPTASHISFLSYPSLQEMFCLKIFSYVQLQGMCNFPKWPCSNVWKQHLARCLAHIFVDAECGIIPVSKSSNSVPALCSHLSSQQCFLAFISVSVASAPTWPRPCNLLVNYLAHNEQFSEY